MDQLLNDFSPGLFFMQAIILVVLIFLMRKFAWKPILTSLETREEGIKNALSAAEEAKKQMEQLSSDNEKLLAEARLERDKILKEAKVASERMLFEAQEKANNEGARLIEQAKEAINLEKAAALAEVKNQVITLSVEIAEKILKKQLSDSGAQQELVGELLKEVNLN